MCVCVYIYRNFNYVICECLFQHPRLVVSNAAFKQKHLFPLCPLVSLKMKPA